MDKHLQKTPSVFNTLQITNNGIEWLLSMHKQTYGFGQKYILLKYTYI